MQRRRFLQVAAATAPVSAIFTAYKASAAPTGKPLIISTWQHNIPANEAAWKMLISGSSALDALCAGIQVPEADPKDKSVGYGGFPDASGKVTLDAAIMNHEHHIGSVMGLENIMHPILVARAVMEKTPHVQLVGHGALEFALKQGFKKQNLLTAKAKEAWKTFVRTGSYTPMTTVDDLQQKGGKSNHDTIGMLALDAAGNLCGGCSTSGMAFKMPGRVGDSPIIGSGLFVDNEVGAATASGVGEEIVRIVGSHTVVEMMRQGKSPKEACQEAVRRILKNKRPEELKEIQAGFIAVNKQGEVGCFALQPGFTMVVTTQAGSVSIEAEYAYKPSK